MSDAAFNNELWIACYKMQIDGYPLGHPSRTNFKPIVTFKRSADGTFNREGTLEMALYADYFTPEQKQELLKRDS